MESVLLCKPLRTAIGTFGGSLKDISAVEMGTLVIREILSNTGLDPNDVDDCIFGNILSAGLGQNPSRQISIKSGLGVETPAITINRLCGSGLQSVVFAAQAIKAGDADCMIAGGTENMSQTPYYIKKARWGYKMSLPRDELIDGMVYDGLWDIFNDYHMGITAENLAEQYQITREEQDEFAYNSQLKTNIAIENGKFDSQIIGIPVKIGKGEIADFNKDEHPRPGVTIDSLAKMKPFFRKDGTVTAGNASGINDGAAALIVASESYAKKSKLEPYARVKSYSIAGVDPSIMGIGPVPAIRKALDKAGLALDDIDLFELNEAFAAQSLACLRDLPIPEYKLNVNGGAIALGHPIGASGAILLVKLLHELKSRKDTRYGICSLCIGGGMGIAMVVEKI